MTLLLKAKWIAKQLSEDEDNVYDILLKNITQPEKLVSDVEYLDLEYEKLKEKAHRF